MSLCVTLDGDEIEAEVNASYCYECSEFYDEDSCPLHGYDALAPAVVSSDPLVFKSGEPDEQYFHYGLGRYAYQLEED